MTDRELRTKMSTSKSDEEVRLEKVETLKRSRAGYMAHLSKLYLEIEKLFVNRENESSVIEKKRDVELSYAKFVDAHMKYVDILDPSENDLAEEAFIAQSKNKLEFDNRTRDWLMEVEEFHNINKEQNIEKNCKDSSQVTVPGSRPANNKSVASEYERLNAVKARESLAELKFKQLQEKHDIERQKQDLKHREEILLLRSEVEYAQLESQLISEGLSIHDNKSQKAHSVVHINSKPPSVVSEVNKHRVDIEPTRDGVELRSDQLSPDVIVPDRNRYTAGSVHVDTEMQHIVLQQHKALQSIVSEFQLPRPELIQFNGDPKAYYKFINNFESHIGNKTYDEGTKLTYLIQLCTGVARDCIEDCVLLDATEGYRQACELLKSRYGKPHIIANAYVSELVNGPVIQGSDGAGLQLLADKMRRCELTLNQMGYRADINNTENLRKIVRRLPIHIRGKWVDRADVLIENGIEPNFLDLTKFIENKARVANTMYGQDLSRSISSGKVQSENSYKSKPYNSISRKATTLATQGENKFTNETVLGQSSVLNSGQSSLQNLEERSVLKCHVCPGSHSLQNCSEFKRMRFSDRRKVTRDKGLCDNCLQEGHFGRGCMKKGACEIHDCRRKHHTLLHFQNPEYKSDTRYKNDNVHVNRIQNYPSTEKVSTDRHCTATVSGKRVCLRIVPVQVEGVYSSIETYALLDEGSDVSLCSNSLVERLGIKGIEKTFTITTVSAEETVNTGQEIKLSISALDNSESVKLNKVWTVDKIPTSPESIPRQSDIANWSHLKGLEFPEIDEKEVTILIGSDIPEVFWVQEERRGRRKEPYAIRSILGWTLMGPVGNTTQSDRFSVNYTKCQDEMLFKQVEMFWKADFGDTLDSKPGLSLEDKQALNIMEKSVTYVDGHYQLELPWRHSSVCLPNNVELAEMRLQQLKRRFQRDATLLDKYTNTMQGYIDNGYAKLVNSEEISNQQKQVWYLPHHPVFHPQKPDKLRIVFDCAAKWKGTSLNDQLLQGPDLTNNLIGVLTRFREKPIAVKADIEAMFHRVRVAPEDCDSLRFLWWTDGDFSKDPETYQMTVHLFGATSSPSCANFSLRKTAQDNSEDFDSEIVNTVLRNFYVDDCLKSVETKSEGIKLVEQLCALLNRGGFRLTKWVSNDMDVLAKIPMNERARSLVNLDMQDISVEHALGVLWNVKTDKFQFDTVKKTKPATRRGVLSIVSSLYDPLGFISPCILPAKILLQSLCKMKIGWDTEMGCEEIKVWKCWLDGLSELTHLNVDRCFKPAEMSQYSEVQLHHFADASQSAYGAVSYLRLLDENGAVHCSFVMGKSRLAPLKSLTIPRLELMAAVLAVKLDKLIKSELDMCVDKTVFWTDSMIVLQYILSESRRFQTFVANRLAMIHEGSNPTQWNHVKSEANPADCASRGLKPIETKKLKKWLNGPEFLWQEERFWLPQPNCINEVSNQDVELKRETKVSFATQSNGLDKLMGFFSTWTRLQRTIAWFLRYKQYCCHRYLKKGTESEIIKGDLIVEELKMATLEVVAYVQRLNFSKEISLLSKCNSNRQESKDNYKVVGPSSPLRKLSPVLVDGILRVGGRLNKAPLSYETKHPYILPNKCHVTELIIHHEHSLVGHLGPVYVLSSLRKFVWILKGHAAVRRVIGNCFQCKRQKAKRGEQYMAELPVERLTPERPPFTHVGVDYFGPLQVKRARSCVKRYGCLFTCLATRALHIEIAHSLETDSFIAALHRFISRRGRPEAIFSDNGSNFKGADRELRDALKTWNQCKISKVLCLQEIQWHFNTPTASHMGGVWERLIRSVRQILRVMLKEQLVSDETLLTVMAEVEKILNDRPLTFVSDDPDDPRPLTPATLLLLKPNSSIPETVCVPADGYCKKIWRQAQYLSDLFWRRWINEYLPTLQLRQKWTECNRNFCVNDIVLVIDEKTVRGQWPLGRIIEVYPDEYGYVRSVKVKTTVSCYVRPVTKLCFLEADSVTIGGHSSSDNDQDGTVAKCN